MNITTNVSSFVAAASPSSTLEVSLYLLVAIVVGFFFYAWTRSMNE